MIGTRLDLTEAEAKKVKAALGVLEKAQAQYQEQLFTRWQNDKYTNSAELERFRTKNAGIREFIEWIAGERI